MSESRNHHYIPQLYLNGFACDDGKIKVYDKQIKKFKPSRYTPKCVFFEKDRNTIEIKGKKTNIIEEGYSKLENYFSIFFKEIRKGLDNESILSEPGIQIIKLYIACQYWRLPAQDKIAEEHIDRIDFNAPDIKILLGITGDDDLNGFKSDKHLRYLMRCFLLPKITFDLSFREDESNYWAVYNNSNGEVWNNILCSDNPIIFENQSDLFSFEGKLVFPLSNKRFIILNMNGRNNSLDPEFSAYMQLIAYGQSNCYVAGTSSNFISKIVNMFENAPSSPTNTLECYKTKLFKMLN